MVPTATPPEPAGPVPAPGVVATPPAEKPPKMLRFARNLRSVARFAKGHWVGLAIALALMSVEAVASAGRIFLFYPVMTRVLSVDDATEGLRDDKPKDDRAREAEGIL